MSEINYNNLQIGQVIYIVSDEEVKIIPVVVSEQVHIKTLEGDTTTWKVILGPKNKRKTLPLEKIVGDKFLDLNQAKSVLISRFTSFLNSTIELCEKKVESWYTTEITMTPKVKAKNGLDDDEESYNPGSLLNSLEESEQPDFNLGDHFEGPRLAQTDTPEARRAKLKAMVEVPEDEQSIPSGRKQKVILPDKTEVFIDVP